MRRTTAILGLVSFGLAVASTYLWRELDQERTRNAELRAHLDARPTRPAPVPPAQAVTAAPPATLPAPSPAPESHAANFAATPAARVEPGAREEAEASQRRMLQQARYREAWRAQQRLNYARRRENVIRLLGFTPEEADAVVEIAIDRHLSWIDRPQQKPVTKEHLQQQLALSGEDRREDDAKLRALLGEEKFARFQQYMESRSTRVQVDQLRPQFTGADALRDDQVEPLIAALHVEYTRLHEEQQAYRTSLHSNDAPPVPDHGERELDLLKAAYERMHTAAAPVLSASQLKRLDTLLKRDLDRQELEAGMLSGAPDTDISNTD
jgi:hypothetical protein